MKYKVLFFLYHFCMMNFSDEIICGDCIELLGAVDKPFADLVFADPQGGLPGQIIGPKRASSAVFRICSEFGPG